MKNTEKVELWTFFKSLQTDQCKNIDIVDVRRSTVVEGFNISVNSDVLPPTIMLGLRMSVKSDVLAPTNILALSIIVVKYITTNYYFSIEYISSQIYYHQVLF